MFRSSVLYTIILFVSILSILCTPATIQKSEKDSGSNLKMNRGDTLEVVLKANPTTGYRWEVASVDSAILKSTSTVYKPNKVPRGIVGSGGKSILRFRATKKGETDLKLIYHRSFEKDVPPVKTFELTVTVKR